MLQNDEIIEQRARDPIQGPRPYSTFLLSKSTEPWPTLLGSGRCRSRYFTPSHRNGPRAFQTFLSGTRPSATADDSSLKCSLLYESIGRVAVSNAGPSLADFDQAEKSIPKIGISRQEVA